jgi:hypothetical protein
MKSVTLSLATLAALIPAALAVGEWGQCGVSSIFIIKVDTDLFFPRVSDTLGPPLATLVSPASNKTIVGDLLFFNACIELTYASKQTIGNVKG